MDNQVKLSSINIVCTEKCNLVCVYCYRKERRNCVNCADLKRIREELERIKNTDISEVVLTGGEPLLYQGFYSAVRMFSEKTITILTNGIIPIKELDDIDEIVISVDGNEEDMYSNRGVSSSQYQAIRQNITNYIKNKKQVTVHCVVTKHNIDNLMNWLKNEPYISQLKFRIVPVSDLEDSGIGLTQSQYGMLLETLKTILQDYNFHIDLSTNVISKKKFIDTVSPEYYLAISPDFNLVTGKYELFDEKYDSYETMINSYPNKMRSVTKLILDYLDNQEDQYLFDPYSLAEKLLKEGGN